MTRDPDHTRRAQDARATRARLVRAGFDLLARDPQLRAGGLRAQRVAERAGVTTGAFFHHFGGQEQYFEQLVAYIATAAVTEAWDQAFDALVAALARGATSDEALRAAAAADLDQALDNDPAWPLALLLFASGEPRRQALGEHFRGLHNHVRGMWVEALDAAGWEPRPPNTLDSIIAAAGGLLTGLATRLRVEPAAVPREVFTAVNAAFLGLLLRRRGDTRTLYDLPGILGRSAPA